MVDFHYSTVNWSSFAPIEPEFRVVIYNIDSNLPVRSDIVSGVVNSTSGAHIGSDFVVATTTTTNPTRNDNEDDDDIIF